MSITVQNLNKAFGEQQVLCDVSFALNKGEVVGFLGPNGAGKSTLMRILTTYYTPDSGSVQVNGFDTLVDKQAVQRSIGYLPEHNPLYLDMYVEEYLTFIAGMYQVPQNSINESIVQTGLRPEAHKKIGQLSKGYRQRVGLAAALQHNPTVLLLDEPTTGLDPNQLTGIRSLIQTLGQEKTILLSTHSMREIEAMCDRVLILNRGVLVADEQLKDLRSEEQQHIVVEFDYRVEEVLLKQLPHTSDVKNIEGFVYEISFTTQKDMRPAVFDFAHKHQLKALQLRRKHKNLERLFRDLTR